VDYHNLVIACKEKREAEEKGWSRGGKSGQMGRSEDEVRAEVQY